MELYLESVLKKQFKKIKSVFESDLKVIQSEDVHELRLAFKKLRAIAQLLTYLAPEKEESEKLTDWFSQVYQQMGLLRDVQVQLVLAKTYEEKLRIDLLVLREYLAQKEKSLYYEVVDMIEDTKVKGKKKYLKIAEFVARKRSKKQLLADSNDAIRKQLSLISRLLLSNTISDEAYHAVRKHLKTAGYIISFMKNDIDINELVVKSKWIKVPENDLGDWHDIVQFRIMLHSLPQDVRDVLPNLSLLETQLTTEAKHLLRVFRIHYDQLIIELEERL